MSKHVWVPIPEEVLEKALKEHRKKNENEDDWGQWKAKACGSPNAGSQNRAGEAGGGKGESPVDGKKPSTWCADAPANWTKERAWAYANGGWYGGYGAPAYEESHDSNAGSSKDHHHAKHIVPWSKPKPLPRKRKMWTREEIIQVDQEDDCDSHEPDE